MSTQLHSSIKKKKACGGRFLRGENFWDMLINPEGSYSNINLRGRSKPEQLWECKEDNKIFTLSTYSVLGTLRIFSHLIITAGLLSTLVIPILKIFLLCHFKCTHKERKCNDEPPCSFSSWKHLSVMFHQYPHTFWFCFCVLK